MAFPLRAATVLLIAAVLPTAAAFAAPFTATYTFTGSPGDQVSEPVDSQPAGATLSDITRGPGLDADNTGLNSFNADDWTTTGAIDAGDYFAFTITPAAGFQMDLTDLDFTERRSGTGILTFEIRTSLDGFASAIATPISVPDNTANRRQQIDLGPAFLDLTGPVEFRIFGYSAQGSGGTWRLGIANGEAGATTFPANLQLVGDLAAVPQPSTLALIGAGMLVVAVAGRLRRRP